jgi:hypothetical protein
MSEDSTTTPVADVSTPAATDTTSTPVGDVAGEVTAAETQSAVESSSQSDGTPATPTTSQNQETEPSNQSPTFSLDTWDGVFDSLPEKIRDIVSKKNKDLEAGYTPKYQELAEQRKAFEAESKKQKDAWTQRESEYALYKAMYEGREDPRLAKVQTELSELTKKYETEKTDWKSQTELLQKKYVELEDAQDNVYVEDFRKRHADMLASEDMRQKFSDFVEKGWDLDVAALLTNQSEEVVNLAAEFARSGVPHEHALQYAELKINGSAPAPRQPRVGAKITNGATPSTNAARVPVADYDKLSLKDAYMQAAKKAFRS